MVPKLSESDSKKSENFQLQEFFNTKSQPDRPNLDQKSMDPSLNFLFVVPNAFSDLTKPIVYQNQSATDSKSTL